MPDESLYTLLRDLAFAPRIGDSLTFAPGERVGRFEVLREVDRGSFGVVYEARDTDLGRHVALKVMRFASLGDAAVVDDVAGLFRREAEVVARLAHPNVVTLYDYGTHAGRPYLVFELLRGETLRQRLGSGSLPLAEALEIAIQLARGLAHAHAAGVIHRDLNPNNVYLLPDGQVKLLDFGIARLKEALLAEEASPPGGNPETSGAGTPAYMAPEQWRGERTSPATDVFSAAVVLHEMLAGRPASELGRSLLEGMAEAPPLGGVPEELAALVAKALRRDPLQRPQSGAELLTALLAVQAVREARLPDADPYRYLEAFSEADQAWFFGRGAETARLRRLLSGRALVGVLGPSGAGKSSLVQAGLVPRLRSEGWTIVIVRPGSDPLGALREEARKLCPGPEDLPGPDELALRPALVGEALRRHARQTGQRVLLVVDQLEELYIREVAAPARAAFVAALLAAADEPQGPIRAVVTLREDHLSRLADTPLLRDEISQALLLLGPPGRGAMLDALRGPARRLGYDFEEGLAEEIVSALADSLAPAGPEMGMTAPLPFLQLTASRLWEKRDRQARLLPRAELGRLAGVWGIVAAHADEVYEGLIEAEEQELAREILLALVSSERTARHEERSALLARFSRKEAAARALEHLVRGRLVVLSRSAGRETIGLAHESLIQGWGQLRGWLEERGEDWKTRERFSLAAAAWVLEGQPRDGLWTGRRLRDLLARVRRTAKTLSPEERLFLQGATALRRRRLFLWALAILLVAGASTLAVYRGLTFYRSGERRIKDASDRADASALVAAAAGADDPLTGALVLAELAGKPEPPGGARVARRLAQRALPRHVLRGHEGPVRSVAFDGAGAWIVTASHDGTVRVWRADGTGAPQVLDAGGGRVLGCALRSDGRLVATASDDTVVRLWRVGRPGPATELRGHRAAVSQVAFSPDGTAVATASRDGTARVWPIGSAGPATVLGGHEGPVREVAFAPRGKGLATVSDDGVVRLWDRGRGARSRALRGHEGPVLAAAFSPDGARLATASRDGTARIWSVRAGRAVAVLRGHRGAVSFVEFSPDGRRVVTGSDDGDARVWSADGTGPPIVLRGHQGPVRTARFSPDGRTVATSSRDGTARLWPADGEQPPILLQGHAGPLREAVFSPSGAWVATASFDGTARVWPAAGPGEPVVLGPAPGRAAPAAAARSAAGAGPLPRTLGVRWAHTADHLVTAHLDGTTRVWRADRKEPIVLGAHRELVFNAVFSPDDSLVATASGDREARIWRWDGSGAPLRLVGHTASVTWADFSPDGRRVLTASLDRTVRVWPVDGRAAPVVLRGHTGSVTDASFSPDGTRVATASSDGTARIWRADGRGKPVVLKGHTSLVRSVDFNPNGTRLVTGSNDGTARVWTASGQETLLVRHGGPVMSARFSPGGARVVSASSDHTARVWRADGSGEPIVLAGHDGPVQSAVFSPDGARILTTSGDNTARLWRADGRGGPDVLRGHEDRVAYGRFNRDGSLVVTASQDGTVRKWRAHWSGLIRSLATSTTACLTAEERHRFLGEKADRARSLHRACERRHRRAETSAPLSPRRPPAKIDERSIVIEHETDRLGGDYRGFFLNAAAPELCRGACVKDSRCLAFTYVKPGIHGRKARCYLKNGASQRRWSRCCASGVVRWSAPIIRPR